MEAILTRRCECTALQRLQTHMNRAKLDKKQVLQDAEARCKQAVVIWITEVKLYKSLAVGECLRSQAAAMTYCCILEMSLFACTRIPHSSSMVNSQLRGT